MILKKIPEIEHLSDLGQSNAWNAWGGPQLFSNVTVGVQPVSNPVGIYFALRYLYDDHSLPLQPIMKNQTPEMKIKPKEFHHHKQEVSKVLLRPKNWNANPGKNENRQKYRYH